MAYARFVADSDVYVLLDVLGYFRCIQCDLPLPHEFFSTAAVVAHLGGHLAAGHGVPQKCFDGLANDRDENDLWIEDVQAGRASADDA